MKKFDITSSIYQYNLKEYFFIMLPNKWTIFEIFGGKQLHFG